MMKKFFTIVFWNVCLVCDGSGGDGDGDDVIM
jgi:hypothetical protein